MVSFAAILLLLPALIGVTNALPTSVVTAEPAPATPTFKTPMFTTGYLPPPPGIEISKHQTPPKDFKIPPQYVSLPPKSPLERRAVEKSGVEERDAARISFKFCDNWYFGGQVLDAEVDAWGGAWLVNWQWPYNIGGRISSFTAFNPAGAYRYCNLYKQYYYEGGYTYCSGTFIQFVLGPDQDTYRRYEKLVSPWNDAIVCITCRNYGF